MEAVLKIAAVALLSVVFGALLKKTSPETALLLALAVCIGILLLLVRQLGEISNFLREVLEWGGLPDSIFTPLCKTVGIALISRTGSELCRDAGEGAIASLMEIAGAFTAILVSIPLLQTVWEMLQSLI